MNVEHRVYELTAKVCQMDSYMEAYSHNIHNLQSQVDGLKGQGAALEHHLTAAEKRLAKLEKDVQFHEEEQVSGIHGRHEEFNALLKRIRGCELRLDKVQPIPPGDDHSTASHIPPHASVPRDCDICNWWLKYIRARNPGFTFWEATEATANDFKLPLAQVKAALKRSLEL